MSAAGTYDGAVYVFTMQAAKPAAPALAGDVSLYFKTDKKPYFEDSTGAEVGIATLSAGGLLIPSLGGTGVANNDASTLTLTGNYATTLTRTGVTAITLPTAGTLATLAGAETLTNKTLTTPIIASISNTGTLTLPTSTDTLVGKATTDVLTNKSISGSTNTLSAIGNGSLTNSSLTIGSTSVSLGGTATTVAGLTLTAPAVTNLTGTLSSPTGTLGAVTLGGTVSGGGNQLNNVIIGAVSPLAVTGTTIAATTGFVTGASGAGSVTVGTGGVGNAGFIMSNAAGVPSGTSGYGHLHATGVGAITNTNYSFASNGVSTIVQAPQGGGGTLYLNGATNWQINSSQHLINGTDNTNDIGAAGATRPRTGYFGTSLITPSLDSGAASNLSLKYNGSTKAAASSTGFDITGAATVSTTLAVTGAITGASYSGGAGSFTTLSASGNITLTGTTLNIVFASPGWSGGVSAYAQAGVNSGGTGAGDNWMFNVPTGKTLSWAVNNSSIMNGSSTGITIPGSLAVTNNTSIGTGAAASSPIFNVNGGTNNGTGPIMQFQRGGGSTHNITTTSYVTGGSSSNFCLLIANTLGYDIYGGATPSLYWSIDSAGAMFNPYTWANTGGTTTVMVDSAGKFFKLASARKYKTDFTPYTKGLEEILKLDPQYYKLRHNPSLTDKQINIGGTDYAYQTMESKEGARDDQVFAGHIADDMDDQGLNEMIAYGPDGEPDSLYALNMFALYTNAIKQLNARLVKAGI